jgi:ubiquinone/menaquinone biosynthesis C-methylase UbiE
MRDDSSAIDRETRRIRDEYGRREKEIDIDLYAPWQPGEMFMVTERERIAAMVLKKVGKFPVTGDRCLEVGYGKLGWLGKLVSWGAKDSDLFGIELDEGRASIARRALPNAQLRVGNANDLPWPNSYFHLVIASTLFSSILDEDFRMSIAKEINRVLEPGGVVLCYDAAVRNPRNKSLKGINRSEIVRLFPNYHHHFRSVTLAPPILRRAAKLNWELATILSTIPFLRTHLLATMVKP